MQKSIVSVSENKKKFSFNLSLSKNLFQMAIFILQVKIF